MTRNFDLLDTQGEDIFQLVAGAQNFEDLSLSFYKVDQFETENFLKLCEQRTIVKAGCPTLPGLLLSAYSLFKLLPSRLAEKALGEKLISV